MSQVDEAAELTLLPESAVRSTRAGGTGEGPLFYLEGATEGTTQWKAELLQVVNWGGFEGAVKVPFNPGSTLVSGASGSGKSTLLDAYIALMMPSDVAFNGASNDAVSGRARSAGQRNLLSYLRGQTDVVPDANGRERPKLLRGDGEATWGAIAMTFVDDHGIRFTALRIYYVPARATVYGDVVSRFVTVEGPLDLAELAPLRDVQFQPKALKAAFDGLVTHDNYGSFATRLHTRLGIGANGDGSKALRLLARIQAGQQIRTVDDLYKEMVLERPGTYEAADRAIEHFDDLDTAYRAMLVEQEKADVLHPITAKYETLTAARDLIEQIDTFGLARPEESPVTLWSRYRERGLLETAVARTQAERRTVAGELTTALTAEQELDVALARARREHQESGGAELVGLGEQIAAAGVERETRRARRALLAEATRALPLPLDDEAAFAAAKSEAVTFLASADEQARDLRDRREALVREEHPLLSRRGELQRDRDSLDGRASRIRGPLHQMRHQVAEAAGMSVDELPFLAELIDVRAGEQRWRTAIETVLGASACTLLVPKDRLAAFSRAIDGVRLGGRLSFEGVPVGLSETGPADAGTVAGKLDFKDSPFSGWVRRHLAEASRNARCVETAADLDGEGYRVTAAGQTRRGSRGTHGRSGGSDVIGFSNEAALAEIEAELEGIERQLADIDRQRRTIDDEAAGVDSRRRAGEAVAAVSWAEIDVAAAERHVADLERQRADILSASDVLQALQQRIDRLGQELEAAREQRFALKRRGDDLERRWAELVEQQDVVSAAIERLEASQAAALDDGQRAALDEFFAEAVGPGDPDDLAAFPQNLARLNARLADKLRAARDDVAAAEADLVGIFAAYKRRFEDPNLGTAVASYPDYAFILEQIVATGLNRQKDAWRQKLMQWSGEDLVPLAGAMESCVQEIEERLEPINDILRNLPFGATADRLRIRLRRTTPEAVTDFRRSLRELASGATRDLADEQLEKRFAALQDFMVRIRRRQDPRSHPERSDRDGLLDVRRHVFVTAERVGPDGEVLSTHSSLGDKSGGESQELIAFIVGAALRFRLGDELRARPRFATVVIDEGFIKSDSEFAGRAVEAWKGLGFQLIVGAPPDKVSALEPHMDDLLLVTKNTRKNYSYVSAVSDARDLELRLMADGLPLPQ
ncbi:ATP-binding protein [Spongisporangium articulatum]|uniref:ATP-binding protein n=1 Tax=Spongisporangium articulatum TaxID=3362603 RepID=A0ABW8APP6_9ACTN